MPLTFDFNDFPSAASSTVSNPSITFSDNGVQFTLSANASNVGVESVGYFPSALGPTQVSVFSSDANPGAFTLSLAQGINTLIGGNNLQFTLGEVTGDWDVTLVASDDTANDVRFEDVSTGMLNGGATTTNFTGIRFTSTSSGPSTLKLGGLTIDSLLCFAEGTEIATPTGPVPIEDLMPGDPILTADGDIVPVAWLGRQTVVSCFAGPKAQLVRIKAGAIGDQIPCRDLDVTGDHAVALDGLLINASALVNHQNIVWVPQYQMPERFTVYNVETEGHHVILANGTPCESFVDYATRRHFDNFDDYLARFGEERAIVENPMPRVSSARMVPPRMAQDISNRTTVLPISA